MKKILLLLSVFAVFAFSSCKKEKINKEDYDKEGKKDWDKEDKDKKACFELVYPVTYTMPDGSDVTGDNEEVVWTAIKTWYESNPNSEEKPVLSYPVEISYEAWDKEDEEEDWKKVIANEEEMILAKKDCYEKDKEACFDLVYPVIYTMPDGSDVTGDNEEAVWTAIKTWYEANPNSEEKPVLEYPVNITYKDWDDEEGDEDWTKVISNEEEMVLAKKDCFEKDKKACFELIYPVTYIMPDGTALAGEKESLWTAIKSWYESNPDSEEKPSLQYPVDILYNDWDEDGQSEGNTATITNEENMIDVKKDCYENKDACFDFVYPISFTMPDGSTLAINGDEDEASLKDWYEANPDSAEKPALQYPVTISFEDETTQAISNEEEMILAKEDCYEMDWEDEE